MEFKVQNIYLIYTWLMVHATLNLAYFKNIYILYTINICIDIIVPESFTMFFVICDCVTVTVTMSCDI